MTSEGLMFWGFCIPPNNKTARLEIGEDDTDLMECVHVSNVALGPTKQSKNASPQCVYIKEESNDAEEIVLGTLIPGSCYQFNVDFVLTKPAIFRTDGDVAVHLSGYKSLSLNATYDDDDLDDEDEMDEDYREDEDEDEEDEDEEDTEEPNADLPNGKASLKVKAAEAGHVLVGVKPIGGKPYPSPETRSDEEDDEFDELADIELGDEDLVGEFIESGDEDDEDEELDDEDEGDEDEEEADEDQGEDEPVTAGEEGEEAKDQKAAAAPESGKKRPAAAGTPPVSAKKQKASTPGPAAHPKVEVKAPASAPAKVPVQKASEVAPGDAAGYQKALVQFVKDNGGTATLSVLGAKVKRPSALPKLKPFINERADVFKLEGDTVKLV